MVIRSAFPSLTNSFLRMRGCTRIEMKLQSPRSLVLKVKKKNQKSRSACNLHNSFPADIDRVFIKPMTFFPFLSFLFFLFLSTSCSPVVLNVNNTFYDPQSTTYKEGYEASCEESQKIGKPYTICRSNPLTKVCKISESQVQPQDKLYPSVYCPRSFKIDGYEPTPISDSGNTDMCCNCFHKYFIYLFISR